MFTSIVQEFKKLLSSDNLTKEKKNFDELILQFNQLKNESTGEEDVNQLLSNDLINALKTKLSDEKELIQKAAEKVKEQKTDLIQQLEELVANEQNIGKAFKSLKIIRLEWTRLNESVGFIQKDVDRQFTKALEDFYYNINIYKAIQDHDLKRNEQLKEEILVKLKSCTEKPTSKALMVELKELRTEWEGIGPVKKELQEDFWTKYREYLDLLYSNFKDFKASEKEEQYENLNLKNTIVDFVSSIDVSTLKNARDWKIIADKVIKVQADWKLIGHVPNTHKDESWKKYRAVCDVFFNAKKEFYDAQKATFKVNKKAKLELIKKAEDLLQAENILDQPNTFVAMQAEWKKIGAVHQRDEQFLWHKFQKSCNEFFNLKKTARKQQDQDKDKNNEAKAAVITAVKNTEDINDDNLLTILKAWWLTNEDFTRKSIQYLKDLEKSFSAKGLNFKELETKFFDEKMEVYSSFENKVDLINRDKIFIQDQIGKVQKEMTQYENNLGFFGNSKGVNPLLQGVHDKIEILQKEVNSFKVQLTKMNKVLKN